MVAASIHLEPNDAIDALRVQKPPVAATDIPLQRASNSGMPAIRYRIKASTKMPR